MKDSPDKLDLGKPLIVLAGVVGAISGLVILFSSINYQREQKIYEEYALEISDYVSRNKSGVGEVFNQIFPYKEPNLRTGSASTFESKPRYSEPDFIAKLLSQDLRDYSSTGFLKASGGNIYFMDLSGNVKQVYPYPEKEKTDLLSLLTGTKPRIPWADYLYEFADKEIVIPIRDDSGKVIGAIVRGVIE